MSAPPERGFLRASAMRRRSPPMLTRAAAISRAWRAAWKTDIKAARFGLESAPTRRLQLASPKGMRPSDLARRLRMWRRAKSITSPGGSDAWFASSVARRSRGRTSPDQSHHGHALEIIRFVHATQGGSRAEWMPSIRQARWGSFMATLRRFAGRGYKIQPRQRTRRRSRARPPPLCAVGSDRTYIDGSTPFMPRRRSSDECAIINSFWAGR